MSMISEQLHYLRSLAADQTSEALYEVFGALNEAADTIESLFAKLQAVNMEQLADDCGKSVLRIETPKVCIDCPCHFAGESGMVMCGVEKRELLSYDIESYKPDWCPLKESADCGGWIPCKERLPDEEKYYLVTIMGWQNKPVIEYCIFQNGKWCLVADGSYEENTSWKEEIESVIAWSEPPEPYHES